jgi:hypothetical protein
MAVIVVPIAGYALPTTAAGRVAGERVIVGALTVME